MTQKVGRNDPCPCGSGKKYKNCHMLQEQETQSAKYTASGKRKFKAKVLSMKDKSLSIFGRSATVQQEAPASDALAKMKFRMTKGDFRTKQKQAPAFEKTESTEQPQERERNLPKPGEEFKITKEDFRKKEED